MTENLDFPEPNFVKGELQCTDKTNEERGKLILDHIYYVLDFFLNTQSFYTNPVGTPLEILPYLHSKIFKIVFILCLINIGTWYNGLYLFQKILSLVL